MCVGGWVGGHARAPRRLPAARRGRSPRPLPLDARPLATQPESPYPPPPATRTIQLDVDFYNYPTNASTNWAFINK